MKNNQLNNNDKIIYEIIVKYDKTKYDTKLVITDKLINLEKEKGFFKKNYKIIESINIEDIKVINEKIQVNNNNLDVTIETNNNTFKVTCNNAKEVKKLVETIKKVKTGENLIERTSSKIVKMGKGVVKTATAIGAAATSTLVVANAIKENKDTLLKVAKVFKNIIKK